MNGLDRNPYATGNTIAMLVGMVPVRARLALMNAMVSIDTCSGKIPDWAKRDAID